MSRKPGASKTSRSKIKRSPRSQRDMSARPDYAVGYGRPPENTQFAKGTSGNPAGRPKGSKNLKTIISDALTAPIVMREGDRTRRVPIVQAIIMKQVENGLKGNDKAAFTLIKIAGQLGLLGDAPSESDVSLSGEDKRILADLLRDREDPADDT